MSEIRSVSVHLDADVAGYIAKMRLAGTETDKAFSGLEKSRLTTLNRQLTGTSTRLDKVATSASKVTTEGRRLEGELGRVNGRVEQQRVKVDAGLRSIDKYSGRLGLLVSVLASLGPAAIPIAGVAVPAVTALGGSVVFLGLGVGVTELAFHGLGSTLQKFNKAAAEPTATNIAAAQQAMDKLPPSAQQLVLQLHNLTPVLDKLRQDAAGGLVPGVSDGLHSLLHDTPLVRQAVRGVSAELGQMAREGGHALASDQWRPFLRFAGQEAPVALHTLGTATGDVVHGLAQILMAFGPLNRNVDAGILKLAQDFDRWASSMGRTKDFQSFVAYIETNGPRVVSLLGDIGQTFVDIVQAAAPLGGPTLQALDLLVKGLDLLASSPLATPLLLLGQIYSVTRLVSSGYTAIGKASSSAFGSKYLAGTKSAVSSLFEVTTAQDRARLSTSELAQVEAERSAQNRATLLKGGAAVAGFAFIASGAADKLGATNTATLALAGSMAGPWGAALGGGIGLLLDFTGGQSKAVASTQQLTDTLDQQTGAITKSTQTYVAHELLQKGVLDDAYSLGLNLQDVTKAALGNADAYQRVMTAARGLGQLDNDHANALIRLKGAIDGTSSSVAHSQHEQRLMAAATGHNASIADAAGASHRQLAASIRAERQAAQATGKQFVTLGADVDNTKVSLRGWIHQLEAEASALTNFGNNARRAADKGLRQGLIAALQEAGPAGALRMRQLANASQTEISRANQAWHDGQQAIRDYSAEVAGVPKVHGTKVTTDVSQAMANVSALRAQIDQLHNKTIIVRAIGGHIVQGQAEGGTVPGQRHPYGDKTLVLAAPGEEVITNRHGEADRFRADRASGMIPRYAGGGTVGPSGAGTGSGGNGHPLTPLQQELHRFQTALADSTKALDREKQHRDALIQQQQQIESTVRDNFRSDIFGGGASGVWGAMSDPAAILHGDIRNARRFEHLDARLARRGASAGLLSQVTTLAEAQQLSGDSPAELRRLSHLYAIRQRASNAAAGVAGDVVVGDRIAESNHHLKQLRGDVHHLTAEVRHLQAAQQKNAHHTGQAVGQAINHGTGRATRRAKP